MKDFGPENHSEYILRFGVHEIESDVANAMFEPTEAMPGSPEKIAVMARRFELGQPIFHNHDRNVVSYNPET